MHILSYYVVRSACVAIARRVRTFIKDIYFRFTLAQSDHRPDAIGIARAAARRVLRDVAHACVTLLLLVTPPLRCARQCAIGRTWLAMPMARVVVFNVYFLLRSSSHIRVYVVCIVPVATPTVYFRHASYSYSRYSLSLSSLLMHNNYISPSLYVLVVGALEVPSSSSFTSSPASSSCSSMMSNSQ